MSACVKAMTVDRPDIYIRAYNSGREFHLDTRCVSLSTRQELGQSHLLKS